MQNCKFCGSLVPDNAYFCGSCGSPIINAAQGAMDVTDPSAGSGMTLDTPPLPSISPHSIVENAETGQQDTDVTIRSGWPGGELVQNIQEPEERDESYPVLPDIMLPGMLVGEEQAPPTGNVPMVHGTPQVGGVPTIQGTPSIPNAAPSGPELAHGAGSSASPPSSAPSWQPQIQAHPVTRIQPSHHIPQTPPPLHHPRPTPTSPEHYEDHPHHHHYRATHHVRRPHTRWLHGARSKVVVGTTTKWIILVVTAIAVIAAGGIVTILAIPPAISLSGSSTVTAGGIVYVQGKGFLPGGNITFTLDNGLSISLIHHSPTRAAVYSADRGASSAGALQMLLVEQSVPQTASNATVSVSTIGTFAVTIRVSTNWSPGLHTLHATESFGSRTAALSFTIIAVPKLLIQQKNLIAGASDCLTITGSGNLIRGWLCTVTLSTDSGDLSWSASSTNPSDRFTPSKGVVHPSHPESVSIFVPNEPRCSNATFTFVGPTNTVSVSWSCPTH